MSYDWAAGGVVWPEGYDAEDDEQAEGARLASWLNKTAVMPSPHACSAACGTAEKD